MLVFHSLSQFSLTCTYINPIANECLLMQSSKGSLERYYSVASVFKCEHFKSMDARLSGTDESADEYCSGNNSTEQFCRSSCYCSVTSAAPNVCNSGTTSAATDPKSVPAITGHCTSSYSQLDTSTDRDSHTRCRVISEDSNESRGSVTTAITRDDYCEGGVNFIIDSSSSIDSSSESKIRSDIIITVDESSEEFFTDVAIDKEDEENGMWYQDCCKHAVDRHCDDVASCWIPSLRRSISMNELISRACNRY